MQFRFKCLSGRSIRKGIITKLLNYTMVILYIMGTVVAQTTPIKVLHSHTDT